MSVIVVATSYVRYVLCLAAVAPTPAPADKKKAGRRNSAQASRFSRRVSSCKRSRSRPGARSDSNAFEESLNLRMNQDAPRAI